MGVYEVFAEYYQTVVGEVQPVGRVEVGLSYRFCEAVGDRLDLGKRLSAGDDAVCWRGIQNLDCSLNSAVFCNVEPHRHNDLHLIEINPVVAACKGKNNEQKKDSPFHRSSPLIDDFGLSPKRFLPPKT